MSSGVVKLRPVLFACAGCPEHGYLAGQAANELDRRNLAERAPLSSQGLAKARSRFPIYTLEGCERACARQWLGAHGVGVQRCDTTTDFNSSKAAQLALDVAARW